MKAVGSPPDPAETLDLVEVTGRKWITLRKFSQLVGKSYPTCLKMARATPQKVRAIKVGGTYRVYEEEVKRFLLEGNATETNDEE